MARIEYDDWITSLDHHVGLDNVESAVEKNHISKVFFCSPNKTCFREHSVSIYKGFSEGDGLRMTFGGLVFEIGYEDLLKIIMAPSRSKVVWSKVDLPASAENPHVQGFYFSVKSEAHVHKDYGPNMIMFYLLPSGRLGVWMEKVFFSGSQIVVPHFGSTAFARSALAARAHNIEKISLLAGGGGGVHAGNWKIQMSGYYFWPSLGFDGPVNPTVWAAASPSGSTFGVTQQTVLDLYEADPAWWKANGDGGFMDFDLRIGSRSWDVLKSTLAQCGLLGETE